MSQIRRIGGMVKRKLEETRRKFIPGTQKNLPESLLRKWTAKSQGPLLDQQTLRYFEENGYTRGVPVLDDEDLGFLQDNFHRLAHDLRGRTIENSVRWRVQNWHLHNEWVWQLLTHTRVLDGVEQILGPDVLLWGSAFYVKVPHDDHVVPWHQDAATWQNTLEPVEAVTAFIPFFDVDRDNGCMQMIAGSHLSPEWFAVHHPEDKKVIFQTETHPDEVDLSKVSDAEMRAGEVMFHHPAVLHRSLGNHSDRWKAVIVGRYCTPAVKCNLERWMDFKTILARGSDTHGHNPSASHPGRGVNRLVPRRNRMAPPLPLRVGRWPKRENFVTRRLADRNGGPQTSG